MLLRAAELSDRAFFVKLLNDPSWLTNIGDRGVRSEADAEAYITSSVWAQYHAYGYGMYVMQLSSTSLPIGICGLVRRDFLSAPDLGVALLPDYVGQGYACEVARELMRYSRDKLGIGRLHAIVKPGNLRSIRLLGRLGFRYEGSCLLPEGGEIELYTAAQQPLDAALA